MSGNVRKITPKQNQAIVELLKGSKVSKAAEVAGVTPRTLTRWLNDETFSAELRRAELQVLDAVGWQLVSMSKQAVDGLKDVLENPGQRGANVKRLCSKAILELLLTWRKQVELEERVTELERKAVRNGNY